MTSNAPTAQLFATWTTDFDVRLNRKTASLEFMPACVDGLYRQPRNLFARPGSNEHRYQVLIEELLTLKEASPNEEWERVARLLGPLFARHPLHHAVANGLIVEPLSEWLQVQRALGELWDSIERLASASSTPLSLEKRREIASGRLATMGLTSPEEASSSDEYEKLLEPHMPPELDTEVHQAIADIGGSASEWFKQPHPVMVPLLNPQSLQVEIVVEMGIQALILISVSLARNNLAAFPTLCARPSCTRIAFMKGSKKYCSISCQAADKTQRARNRKKAKLTGN